MRQDLGGRNPREIVFDALRAAAPRPGARIPVEALRARVAEDGVDEDAMTEALGGWESLGMLDWAAAGRWAWSRLRGARRCATWTHPEGWKREELYPLAAALLWGGVLPLCRSSMALERRV